MGLQRHSGYQRIDSRLWPWPGAPVWVVDDTHAPYGGQTVPALGIQAFGNASFHWNLGSYQHTLYADALSEGSGVCEGATHTFIGTVPHHAYVTMDHHLE